MITRIHVNQQIIRKNKKTGESQPPLSAKTYKSNDYASEIYIDGPCKVVYRPNRPLPCGAVCWVETESQIRKVR